MRRLLCLLLGHNWHGDGVQTEVYAVFYLRRCSRCRELQRRRQNARPVRWERVDAA